MKRVFLIVLDSVGIGEMPDAAEYGDAGSNTLRACFKSEKFDMPNMKKLGLFNINGIDYAPKETVPTASFARMSEQSKGKDTIIGHWEIAGIISEKQHPTYPKGFPPEIIEKFKIATNKGVLCNKPYSGTKLLEDYGQKSVETGKLIVYTSADSVFQIAAHEDVVPAEKLYEYCEKAREILVGEHAVGRVIARPFTGEYPNFKRTSNRRDFSLTPPKMTMLEQLQKKGFDVISIGKINDIFNGKGITHKIKTHDNEEGLFKTLEVMKQDFEGLCFVNLVDFDMLYGHRNDVDGYANALAFFDKKLHDVINELKSEDILIITADHGCDPSTASTDHSREYTPMIIFGEKVKSGINLGTRSSFSDIGATILEYFKIIPNIEGESFLKEVFRQWN